jgi:tRNA1(Val) A37 N6-methylase TrmN6
MGAQAAGVARYIATDIEPLTVRGNRELAEALEYDGAEIHEARAEAFDPGPVDLVFTSPPYFNLETYGPSSEAAYSEYGDAEGWVDQFLVPVMTRAAGRLKPGGHLVLNLPLKPVKGLRLDLAALEVAQRLKLTPRVTVYLPIRSKNRSKREPLLVWER